jgi:hypothetical protein
MFFLNMTATLNYFALFLLEIHFQAHNMPANYSSCFYFSKCEILLCINKFEMFYEKIRCRVRWMESLQNERAVSNCFDMIGCTEKKVHLVRRNSNDIPRGEVERGSPRFQTNGR